MLEWKPSSFNFKPPFRGPLSQGMVPQHGMKRGHAPSNLAPIYEKGETSNAEVVIPNAAILESFFIMKLVVTVNILMHPMRIHCNRYFK